MQIPINKEVSTVFLMPKIVISLIIFVLSQMVLLVAPAKAGYIKVCKVAGEGVTEGTEFTFGDSVGNQTTVPAGPAPGGYCFPMLGGGYPDGTQVDITELGPAGYEVVDIVVQPGNRLVGSPDLSGKTVSVIAGSGITEVTFINERRFGFLEICKEGNVEGFFEFEISPGNIPVTVPAGACSPAIEVPAGNITITEVPNPSSVLTGCRTIPAGRQGDCSISGSSSTVEIVAGDISTQTIAFFENSDGVRNDDGDDPRQEFSSLPKNAKEVAFVNFPSSGGVMFTEPEVVKISCDSVSDRESMLKACTAKINANSTHSSQAPGAVHFKNGDKIVAIIPIRNDGTAILAMPASFNISDMTASFVAHQNGNSLENPEKRQSDYKKYKPGEASPTDNEADRLNEQQKSKFGG